MNITNERLRNLCIKHQWFTEGSSRQYDKLFYANSHGAPLEEIVTLIWLCSDTEKWCRRDIKSKLTSDTDIIIEYTVWCVDSASCLSGMIHSRLFSDYESAKAYYDSIGDDTYRKMYHTPDIWGWTERKWKDGETI